MKFKKKLKKPKKGQIMLNKLAFEKIKRDQNIIQ